MVEDQNIEEQSISIGEIFNIIKKHFWFLVATTITAALVLGVYAFSIAKPKYKSVGAVMVQVNTGVDSPTNSVESQRLIQTVMQLLTDVSTVTEPTSLNLKNKHQINITDKQIKSGLSVGNKANGLIVTVSFTSENKEQAKIITNEVIDTLIDVTSDPDIGISMTFEGNIAKLDVADALYVSPNKTLLVLVGAILGGTIGLVVVFVREMITSGYRTKEELEHATKTLVLGVIPHVEGDQLWKILIPLKESKN